MTTLVAGPFLGEFGHELMSWQAFARHRSREYEQTIICCRKDRMPLYDDFADSFRIIDAPIDCDGQTCSGWEAHRDEAQAWASNRGCKYLAPRCFMPTEPAEWCRYGQDSPRDSGLLIVHARAKTVLDTGNRNWPAEKWLELISRISGLWSQIAFIGSKEEAGYYPEARSLDMRGCPLDEICDLLSYASLIIGPSSGPIHLAALCACPMLVWTDINHLGENDLRNGERLRGIWNPFGADVRLIDGWDPDVDTVVKALDEMKERNRGEIQRST